MFYLCVMNTLYRVAHRNTCELMICLLDFKRCEGAISFAIMSFLYLSLI